MPKRILPLLVMRVALTGLRALLWAGLVQGLLLFSFSCGGSGGGGGNPPPAPAPVASLSPASLSFGSQNIGSSSAAQSVTLSNTGNAALSISSIAASGDFAETGNCGTSLSAGSNCTIQVTFKPTAAGSRTGTLTVTDNASGSPQSASLSGTGTTSGGGIAYRFFVAANGNDSWSGTLDAPNANNTDGPFATFDRARLAVQTLDKGSLSAVIVQFRAGTYALTASEQFVAADSGTAGTEITYENYPGESPIISGGVQITDWTPSTSVAGAWQASVAGLKPFEQLWVNGQRRYRVQVPVSGSSGYFYNLGPVDVTSSTGCTNPNYPNGYSPSVQVTSGAHSGQYECYDRFFFENGDINSNWIGFSDPNHPIEVIDFEDWTIARMRLYQIEPSSGYPGFPANSSVADLVGATVRGTYWGFLAGHRYLIDNVKDVLSGSTPGEWYLDEDASGNPTILTYVPEAGEEFANNPPVVIAPQINQLVVAADPNGFSYVSFKGLTFSYANWVAGSPGYSIYNGGQASSSGTVPAALSFTFASHITLDSVIVSRVGGWGAEFVGTNADFTAPSSACSAQNSQNCNNQIINSMFNDLGSGAVRIGGEPANSDTDANVAQYNLVYNTVMAGGDRMLPGNALWIGNSHNNVVDHNDIHDFYNQGIALGDSLNFNGNGFPNWTHDNQITHDLVYQLGQGVTSDMGAVHAATGLTLGNVISNNNFHDIANDPGPGGYGGWGIYLDQGSSFLTIQNNLVYNTTVNGFHYNASQKGTYQLNGAPSLLENNIFAFGVQGSVTRTGSDDGALDFTFERNIFYWDEDSPPRGPVSPQNGAWTCSTGPYTTCFDFQNNMYYSTTDPTMTTWRFVTGGPSYTTYTLAQWQATPSPAEDIGSTVNVDPLFVCPSPNPCGASAPYNFGLQSGSQAPSLIGFQPFDATQAGRLNPVLLPAALPPAFPLQLPSSY